MKMQTPRKDGRKIPASRKGVALLVTLWLTFILTALVLSFSYMARTEAHSMASFKSGTEHKYLAEAGMQWAIMEIAYRNLYKSRNVVMEGREAFQADGTAYTGRLGDGFYQVRIFDESGKLDINEMTDASGILLNNLLVRLGVEKDTADTIVDSILDWKDNDDFRRLHGAESDYYRTLPVPYSAKNAKFDTLEELLHVKGVTPEILFGKGFRKGLARFLTVHSGKSAVNIDAAPKEMLLAISGMTEEVAEGIIRDRQSGATEQVGAVHVLLAKNNPLIAPYIGTGGSNTYTIESLGYMCDEKSGFGIRATVVVVDPNTFRYVYYRSPARVMP